MILLNTFMMYSLLSCTNLLPSLAAPQLPSGNAQCMAGLLPPGATESRDCGEFGESGLGASGANLLRGAVASLRLKNLNDIGAVLPLILQERSLHRQQQHSGQSEYSAENTVAEK